MQFEKLSKEKRKALKEAALNEKKLTEAEWHLIFALMPLRVTSTKVVWLERVYRRRIFNSYGEDRGYVYKTKGDFMTAALKTGEVH